MDCRTRASLKFRTRLGFKKYDVILIREQSALSKQKFYLKEKICKQYIVLGFRTDLFIFMAIN